VLALQQDAFAAIVARDMSFYDEYPSGKIVSRVTSDTEKFATVVTLTPQSLESVTVILSHRGSAILHQRQAGVTGVN